MDIVGWSLDLIGALGGPGVALVLAAENLVAVIPGELLLPFVGMRAARDDLGLAWALFWTTLGSVAGAYVIYAMGYLLGPRRATELLVRIPLVERADVLRANALFDRWGGLAVVVVRWIPMVRALISLPAGTRRMNPLLFGLCTAVGSGLWNALFVVAGYYLGQRGSDRLNGVVSAYSLVLAVVGAFALSGLVALRLLRRRRAGNGPLT